MSHDPDPGRQEGQQPYRPQNDYQQPYQPQYRPQDEQAHQQRYLQQYQQPYGQVGRSLEGENAAQLSLILGLVGLFFAGMILGPIAIWQARKAEKLGVQATAGKVLGWVSTILWLIGVVSFIAFFVIVFATLGAAGTYSG